jgi:hypothetical protein
MGVKQISDDQAVLQFEKVSFISVGAYGNTPFGWKGKFLPISMSHPEKNILKNKMANQRKEN